MGRSRIPLAGVVGDPVAHSRSPRIHGRWLAHHGLAGHYVPLQVGAGDLEAVLAALPQMGFVGVNVTIPHKERALALAGEATELAAAVGAANTLTFRADGSFVADSTDGVGFLASLREGAPGWDPAAGPAAVLGAGGAALAVVAALLGAGAPEVRIANRTRARADAIRERFGTDVSVFDWDGAGEMLEGAAMVANATSLGMEGGPPLEVPLDRLDPVAVAADLVYAPLRTRFLADAQARGCRTVDGLGMLLHQAVPGFERWFGIRPEVDRAAREAALQ